MSGYRVQCSGCGYLTYASDEPCPRCGTFLSEARVVGDADSGATIYTGDALLGSFEIDHTEAMGSLPDLAPDESLPAIGPMPSPAPRPAPAPELPEIGFAGTWEPIPPPLPLVEEIVPIADDPRLSASAWKTAADAEPARDQDWSTQAPPVVHQAPPMPPPRPSAPHHTTFAPPVARVAPPKRGLSPGLWIGIAAASIAAIGLGVLAAAVWSSGGRPSTEETRRKYAPILAGQPDFVATLEGFENGVPIKTRYAVFNGERLIEVPLPKSMFLDTSASGATQVTVIFNKDDKVTAIAHEFWVYRTVPTSNLGALVSAADPFGELGRIAKEKTTTIIEAGTEKVGDYDTTVLLISTKASEPIQANIAPSLGNLVVRLDIPAGAANSSVPMRYTLSNVSMTVDPELFRIPTSYDQLKAP